MKKKFRILEESRFLKKETLQHLVGGDCAPVSSICTVSSPYKSDTCFPWTTCGGQVVGQYEICHNINHSCPREIHYGFVHDQCDIPAVIFTINCGPSMPY